MKWYNHRIHTAHVEDIAAVRVDINGTDITDQARIYEHVGVVAREFGREYTKIGILDYNDLLQEGYCAMLEAWESVNWDYVEWADEPEAFLWGYMKKAITNGIRGAIMDKRMDIRIPRSQYRLTDNSVDVFLSQTFSEAFGDNYFDLIDDGGNYWNDMLNEFLDSLMDELLSFKARDIIKKMYGMDEHLDKKVPVKEIAEFYNMKYKGVQKSKERSLKTLISNKDRIQKFLDDEAVF